MGVTCAVFDDAGQVLISRRGDIDVWNLPGGRLDSGELLEAAAIREVLEETGIEIEIERPVGLYYTTGWSRLNVLYRARAVGGTLLPRTRETRENRFCPPEALPANMLRPFLVEHAMDEGPAPLLTIETPPDELRRLRWLFVRRWFINLLSGRPEPRYPRLNVHAGLAIWDPAQQRVLSVRVEHEQRILRVRCNGKSAPWEQMVEIVQGQCGWSDMQLVWRGIVQNPSLGLILFVFSTAARDDAYCSGLQWAYIASEEMLSLDRRYLRQMLDAGDAVWTLNVS